MSYQAIREYLIKILERYKNLNKKGKTTLLNEAILITGLTRKHLIRELQGPVERVQKKKASGRSPRYPVELLTPIIRDLWFQMEQISGRRMKAALPEWLPFYKNPNFTPQIYRLLEEMSAATLERFLRRIRAAGKAAIGLSVTPTGGSPSRHMKNKVPLNTFDFKIERPGFCQADTVGHCGTTTAGKYVNTITLTDIDSTWTENRAIFEKNAHNVRRQFVDLDQTLPFTLLAVNVDNGSEFLNNQLFNFMRGESGKKPITFTRSRAYKKNDNCYVEQKNYTHVRELFGYERIEDPDLVWRMNEIYKTCWNPLHNFFLPTFKLKEKIRIGARIVKKFEKPQTPYDRLMNSPHLSIEQKERLKLIKNGLNPFHLKSDLENKLKEFFAELRKSNQRKAS